MNSNPALVIDPNAYLGCIGIAGPRAGGTLFQRLVMFFTDSWASHCFVKTFAEDNKVPAVIEASLCVTKTPFIDHYVDPKANMIFELWRPVGADPEAVEEALLGVFKDYAGETYGFMQLLWYAWRWVCKKLGLKPPDHNWFPGGEVCSELGHDTIDRYGGVHAMLQKSEMPDGNLVAPSDLLDHFHRFRGRWELAYTNREAA